ncbi:MAG: damage-control phosphatase ARMT1 family protein [Candidatus Helarchaeota archaeon]
MKVSARCAKCLFARGIAQTFLATNDTDLQFKIINGLCSLFQEKFNRNAIPAIIGTWRDRIIKKISNNDDPYKKEKEISNQIALDFEPILEKKYYGISNTYQRFRLSVLIAIIGNIIEFNIQDHDITTKNLSRNLERLLITVEEDLVIDEIRTFYNYLKSNLKILYLTDNAGEILFDKFLIKELRDMNTKVTVAVKAKSALNDAMMKDAIKVGLNKIKNIKLITTENDHVGIILDEISPNFQRNINEADVIIAKGMGYFECLYNEPGLNKPILHLFRTKCHTVARSLNVDINKNISIFRNDFFT